MKYLSIIILLFLLFACDWFNKQDPDPVEKVTIYNEQPAEGSYTDKHKGETQAFSFDSNSELGLPLEEFYRVDGKKVDNDNEYTHTFDKGVTTIEGIAKTKEDSAKVTWIYSVENQSPIATSKSITSDEETTTSIPEEELGYDPDGDELDYSIISTSSGIDAKFENNNLVITREKDFYGSAEINYRISDGEATANGKVSDEIKNTPDNPNANAGTDKTGTINEEINLDGKASNHPDNPISNITQYLWRALNEEGNITITNSDQANAKLNANTRGNYQIELTVTDDKGQTDKDTVNVNIDSYKILVNATNVLNDENIAGLEVMLAEKTAVDEAIEKINQELPFEVYRKTTGDDARYVFDYSKSGSSSFHYDEVQVDGLWYIDTATIYINKNSTVNGFEILKGDVTHELFTHGLGFRKHSDDPQDVSSTPVWDSDITTNEKNAIEINIKLKTNTDLDNYQAE